jgi:aldehyde:ferredoxin oxidoreductase
VVAVSFDRLMERPKPTPKLKEINMEIARGKGSARFRDKRKANGGGGTWANYEALNPLHAMPEMNFNPTGKDVSHHLWRPAVEEEGTFMVKDEACFRCGIACHKNVYETNGVDKRGRPKAGKFRAKLDFEPLNLLSSNIGIFDMDEACELVELVDLYCMDSISLAVTLSYAMEYNKRHADDGKSIAGGLSYGDYEATRKAIEAIGTGKLPELGQGSKRLSESLDETDYAMHCKGMEFPAYLPQTNPGYPWALAGGHMSMKTYLLLLFERDTSLDYWVDAITNRGPMIMRDDMLGVCKFSALSDDTMCEALAELCDLKVEPQELRDTVMRTYIRGYRIEREQGFSNDDYVMPKAAHDAYPQIELPHFNTPEFFDKVKARVIEAFDTRVKEASY